ncbi:MAG: hypothetical protein U0N22_04760 [Acutalibacter sp.]
MNNINITVWDRQLDLSIVFDCYKNEAVLPIQEEALNKLLASDAIDNSKSSVEKYCLSNNGQEIGEDKISNIFKYVMPYSLYIRRTTSADRIVGLVCKYRFNPEDGLVILFKNEELIDIGTTDIL